MWIFSTYQKFVSHSTLTSVDVLYWVRLLSFVPFFLCNVNLILLVGFDSISNMLFAAADVLSYSLPCHEVSAGKSARSLSQSLEWNSSFVYFQLSSFFSKPEFWVGDVCLEGCHRTVWVTIRAAISCECPQHSGLPLLLHIFTCYLLLLRIWCAEYAYVHCLAWAEACTSKLLALCSTEWQTPTYPITYRHFGFL